MVESLQRIYHGSGIIMYEITWLDGRQEIICDTKKGVMDTVARIGIDGGIVKWITEHKAVISFYNTIMAYVNYHECKSRVSFLTELTYEAVQALPNDEAKELLIGYDNYVKEHIDNETYEDIESLLYFIAFIWANRLE